MANKPTEAEIQDMWKKAVNILETTRVNADTAAQDAGIIGAFEDVLTGDLMAQRGAEAAEVFRSVLSSAVDSSMARTFLEPLLFEWRAVITEGDGYETEADLLRAIYDHHHTSSPPQTIQARDITYDTSATTGKFGSTGTIDGNGAMKRLTEDWNGYPLEACFPERKQFRCVADQSSGTREHAEEFEHVGQLASIDALNHLEDINSTPRFGSGARSRTTIVSKHAGAGRGGSLLQNSSFSDFDSAATNKFTGWTASGTGTLTQSTDDFYRSHPGASTDASMIMDVDSSNTLTVKQAVDAMRVRQLDSDAPYFFRVMVNGAIENAAGGNVHIRLGSQGATGSSTIAVASLGSGWTELFIDLDQNTWFRSFNADPLDVEIEWAGGTGGKLYFDDAILAPYDLIDGTYWCLVGGTTPWLLDDQLVFTDTASATNAKLQFWWWRAFGTYLPSTTGTEVITDP